MSPEKRVMEKTAARVMISHFDIASIGLSADRFAVSMTSFQLASRASTLWTPSEDGPLAAGSR